MKYKLTIETPDDLISIQCNNIESVKRFADCVAGFILPEGQQDACDEDGWIKWGGGDSPVREGEIIDVRHRDGEEFFGVVVGEYPALNRNWKNDSLRGDIVAYRLHKSEEQNQ